MVEEKEVGVWKMRQDEKADRNWAGLPVRKIIWTMDAWSVSNSRKNTNFAENSLPDSQSIQPVIP
jgi:hypothetical protein